MGEIKERRSLLISPKFSVDDWHRLGLDAVEPEQQEWEKAVAVLQDRLEGRFFRPAQTLIEAEACKSQKTFGFAILALDFLVLETIQGFKEGLVDHKDNSARLFKAFLADWQPFTACLEVGMKAQKKAGELYVQGRCALHHAGTTDGMRVRMSGQLIKFLSDGSIEINRSEFHRELQAEFDRYLAALRNPACVALRQNFAKKMNAICGL